MIDHSTPPAGVLVGVDGSPATAGAVRWAAREAARRHLPLDLVQVLPPSERPHDELRSPSGRAHALLERPVRSPAPWRRRCTVRLSVVDGVAGPALVATASRARLLVIGARPGSGLADTGVGRTVAHVMGHAPCPVIVVPPGWEPAEDEASRGVLVGVDGSLEARGAIAFGADVADRSRSTLVTASVTPRLGGPDEETRRRDLAEAAAGIATTHPDCSSARWCGGARRARRSSTSPGRREPGGARLARAGGRRGRAAGLDEPAGRPLRALPGRGAAPAGRRDLGAPRAHLRG